MFSSLPKTNFDSLVTFILSTTNSFNIDQFKILLFGKELTLHSIDTLTHERQTAFENIVGNGKIDCNEQFLLSPQCFLLNQITISTFVHIFYIISLFAAEFKKPKIGI